MSVIKGCLKEESKELKKLVMMYWEVVKKYDAEGNLLPEMILVRAALPYVRTDVRTYVRSAKHPYIQNCSPTVFVCKS